MPTGLKGKAAAISLAAVLAAGMCPAFASATELTASADTAKSTPAVQTQAGKKTVYVLTSITENTKYKFRDSNDEVHNGSEKKTVKLTYNSKGLLTKSNYTYRNPASGKAVDTRKCAHAWTYSKKNLITKIKKNNGTVKLTRNSAGRVTKATTSWGTKILFTYKSGRIVKTKTTNSSDPNYTETRKLTYKNGKPATIKSTSTYGSSSYKPVYDKHGNMITAGSSISYTFKMKYNSKGQLVKRSRSNFSERTGLGDSQAIAYKYKPIKVSKSLAPIIEAQQWALLNDNFNYAIDPMLGEGYFNCTNNFEN